MDDKSVNSKQPKSNNSSQVSKKTSNQVNVPKVPSGAPKIPAQRPNENANLQERNTGNSSGNNTLTGPVKVPKQAAVVSASKTSSKIEDAKLKRQLDKQVKDAEKKHQQEEKEEAKQKRQQQQALNKQEQEAVKEQKAKDRQEKKALKLEEKKTRREEKRLQKEAKEHARLEKEVKKKDYGLDDLTSLENKVLKRKEEKEERRRKAIIIFLITILVGMFVFGSVTVVDIINDRQPEPVLVDIEIETENLDPLIPDPNNPGQYLDRLMYPGDSININFYVASNTITESVGVYVRFRAYIIIDEVTEHSVFIPTFVNPYAWYSLMDEEGNDLDIDDWYYYGGLLETGEENKIQIINKLTLRTDLDNYYQGKEFTLVLRIEAIQGVEEAVRDFEEWWLAPEEWFNFMGINPYDQ